MLNMSRESTCFLRIKTPSIAGLLALTSGPVEVSERHQ